MGRDSKSRRERAQGRQDPGTPARSASAEPTRAASPEQLLAKYGAAPIRELPGPVEKFHLKIVTEVLEGFDQCARPVAVERGTQTWHGHHDGLAASRPRELNFGGVIKNLACAPGCNHCCRSPVGVVAAEAVVVADVIDRTFSDEQKRGLAARMAERKAELHSGDPLRSSLCPLNVAGRCTVYAVRPHNCRIFHSFDVDVCERQFVAGEQQRGIPIDPVRRKYDRLISASATVAFTAVKLDMRNLEFMAALEIALAAGEHRVERFAAGEDLFAGLPTVAPPSTTS